MATGSKEILLSKGIDTYDSITATIEWLYNNKKFYSYHLTNWIEHKNSSAMSYQNIKILGTNGRLDSDQKKRGLNIICDSGNEQINPYFSKLFIDNNHNYYIDGYGPKSICNFINSVINNDQKLICKNTSFEDALISVTVSESVNQSLAQANEWVDVK